MKLYEAMFLVDSNKAKQDHAKVVEELSALIQKGGGQVVNCDKWEERKLAYPVAKRKRGTYYLAHFNAEGPAIAKIERAAQLSETILRALVVCDEDGPAFPVFEVEPEEEGFGREGGPPRGRGDESGGGPRRSEGAVAPQGGAPRAEPPRSAPPPSGGAAGAGS